MKTSSDRVLIAGCLALAAGLLLPGRAIADSLTFYVDGNPQETVSSYSVLPGSSGNGVGKVTPNQLTIVTPIPDPLGTSLPASVQVGAHFPTVTIYVFNTTATGGTSGSLSEGVTFVYLTGTIMPGNGVPNLVETLVFGDDTVSAISMGGGPSPTPTPEPSTLLLFGSGLASLFAYRKRRGTGFLEAPKR